MNEIENVMESDNMLHFVLKRNLFSLRNLVELNKKKLLTSLDTYKEVMMKHICSCDVKSYFKLAFIVFLNKCMRNLNPLLILKN